MNLPTIVIALVIAGLLALAVRRLVRRGTCSACEQKGACPGAGAACAGRGSVPVGQAGPVALGMPGGLTRATSAGAPAPGAGACCGAERDRDPAATPATKPRPAVAGR